ncbi:MAG: fibronectin type III domain-containing protein [Flavobacteriales bacterium]|nr:fibronectin type III domain-containing protein [Flavobacteriales bacterium]
MQTVFIVKLGLEGLTPTALVEKGRNLVKSCTGNTNVTLPVDFLTDLGAACTALEQANIAVRDNGGRQDHLIRDGRVRNVEDLIRELAGYVQAQCGGDKEKMASTGFGVRRQPTPVGVLDAPGNLRARRGKLPGEIHVIWDGVYARLLYGLYYTEGDPKDESSWKLLVQTSKNRYTATGLTSDKVYFFRVQAIGAAGAGEMSDSAEAKAA